MEGDDLRKQLRDVTIERNRLLRLMDSALNGPWEPWHLKEAETIVAKSAPSASCIVDALEYLTVSVRNLIKDSDGVAGFHLNGAVAPWGELTFLVTDLEHAERVLAQITGDDDT